jgi:molybdopterin-guanine dinucleotide biosynthesis protein B
VIVASDTRLALMREFEVPNRPTVHQLLAELYQGVDWVLVEGFKDSDLLKVEVWRASSGQPARYMEDAFITAIATDSPDQLPVPTGLQVLDLNDPQAVANWLLSQGERFEYNPDNHQ